MLKSFLLITVIKKIKMNIEKSYSKKELKGFKKILKKKLRKAKKERDQLKALYINQKEYIGNAVSAGAGIGQYMPEKAMLKKLRKRIEGKVMKIEDALDRIKNGSYGICQVTGKLIDPRRLKAKPTATKINRVLRQE